MKPLTTSRPVYLAEFADGYGCNGPETEALVLFSSPHTRQEVSEIFQSTRTPDLKATAASHLVPPPPTPLWGPQWPTVGEYQDAVADHRRARSDYATLLEQEIAATRALRYSQSNLQTFYPLNWWPGGDHTPHVLSVTDEHGCHCAYGSRINTDSGPANTPPAWLAQTETHTYLSMVTLAPDVAVSIIATAEADATAASTSYAAELATRAEFQALPDAELRLLDFAAFEQYEHRRKQLTERSWSYTSTPEQVYTRKLYAHMIEHGVLPIRLDTAPGTYPNGLYDDEE